MTLLQQAINNAQYLKITYFRRIMTDYGNYFAQLLQNLAITSVRTLLAPNFLLFLKHQVVVDTLQTIAIVIV